LDVCIHGNGGTWYRRIGCVEGKAPGIQAATRERAVIRYSYDTRARHRNVPRGVRRAYEDAPPLRGIFIHGKISLRMPSGELGL
jgi:hypothetical protein